jgi:hypothetical protein
VTSAPAAITTRHLPVDTSQTANVNYKHWIGEA